MVRRSTDGEKHSELLKASKLLGGYIAIGKVNEEQAIRTLEYEINNKDISDKQGALITIRKGIDYGKLQPISEAIKLERAERFIKTQTGEFDFLASESEMDKLLYD